MILTFIFVFAGWILSLSLHEFAHALVAYWGGDHTVKDKGYLTMNPLKYTHPLLSFGLPILFMLMGGIGLPGGAVYIDRTRLRSRWWDSAVSAAGPSANFIIVLLMGLPFVLGIVDPVESDLWVWPAYTFLMMLNISAVLFNLIPVPPLDGWGIVSPWLPRSIQDLERNVGSFSLFIVIGLFWFDTPVRDIFWLTIFIVLYILGGDLDQSFEGWNQFQFWAR